MISTTKALIVDLIHVQLYWHFSQSFEFPIVEYISQDHSIVADNDTDIPISNLYSQLCSISSSILILPNNFYKFLYISLRLYLYQKVANTKLTEVHLKDFSGGMYWVKLVNEDGVFVELFKIL